MSDEIIMVAGVNYPEYKKENNAPKWKLSSLEAGNWRKYCLRVATSKLKRKRSLRVALFDFLTGTREVVSLRGAKVVTAVEDNLGSLNLSDYRRREEVAGVIRFVIPESKRRDLEEPQVRYITAVSDLSKSGTVDLVDYRKRFYGASPIPPTTRSISVVDVYDYIKGVGASRPGTLTELHLFSHGFSGGPIFANTDEIGLKDKADPTDRDPMDKDGRGSKDFLPPDMGGGTFRNAFSRRATVHVWGCNATVYYKRLILETLKQKKSVRDPSDKRLSFRWNSDWEVSSDTFHDDLGGSLSDPRSALQNLDKIKELLTEEIESTYMKKLAEATGARVLGGLPGTFSDYDKNKKFGELLLHVPMGREFGDVDEDDNVTNFQRILRFYKETLGVHFEPEDGYSRVFGRGYGIFEASAP